LNADHPDFFDLIYRENYPGIYRYSFRLVGNSEEAEQLTQESFKSLYALFTNGTRIVDFKALAYRITHNVCLNFLKRNDKLKKIIKQETLLSGPSAPSAEDVLIANQRVEYLRQAILGLSKRDQECLLLYLEGFSYKEIAEIAHIRRTSIGKVLARAIDSLSGICLQRELR
jgi:RNA polymerase sigma-70 factor (ECF subfamily)